MFEQELNSTQFLQLNLCGEAWFGELNDSFPFSSYVPLETWIFSTFKIHIQLHNWFNCSLYVALCDSIIEMEFFAVKCLQIIVVMFWHYCLGQLGSCTQWKERTKRGPIEGWRGTDIKKRTMGWKICYLIIHRTF